MAYYGLVTTLNNYQKDPNSDNIWITECFGESVIVGPGMEENEKILYLPSGGRIMRWFGDELALFRENLDGTPQGGYVENNGHIRAIKLRGNRSEGIIISYSRIVEVFGEQDWTIGDKVDKINGKLFCAKYTPSRSSHTSSTKTSTKKSKSKAKGKLYPNFAMHEDTDQLMRNLDRFKPGDICTITLKLHGTSQRSMNTYYEKPNGFFRKLFRMKKRQVQDFVMGSRRMTFTDEDISSGFYGNILFRLRHHESLRYHLEPGMEVFYEVVGYYGPGETETIMPSCNNSKLNDKNFTKLFGPVTTFSYGCKPGESAMWIYRITSNNGEKEWTTDEIRNWCEKKGFNMVPIVSKFVFTTKEDLLERINLYLEDLRDPVGKTHLKEGVVVRIENRLSFTAFKFKVFEFKVLSGIAAESATDSKMAEDVMEEF